MILLFHLLAVVAKYYCNRFKLLQIYYASNKTLQCQGNGYEKRFEGPCALYKSNGDLYFDPPVYSQRYSFVQQIIFDEQWRSNLKKVVDFGCAELNFFKCLKHIATIEEVLEVDIDSAVLSENIYKVDALIADYLKRRPSPLNVYVLHGSIADPDSRLIGCDMVIAIEIIEHLFPDTLEAVPYNVFHFIQPLIAVFTTPNADFNVLFSNFKLFRHFDHKFEWSRAQFEEWALHITRRFPNYTVTFGGIGAPPDDKSNVGCCTQYAIFLRQYEIVKKNNADCTDNSSYGICTYLSKNLKSEKDEINMTHSSDEILSETPTMDYYDVVFKISYPYEIDNKTLDEKVLLEVKYRLLNLNKYSEYLVPDSNRLEYPISKLYNSVQNLCTFKYFKSLLSSHYQLEDRQLENNLEQYVLYDLPEEASSSEQSDDSWCFKENENPESDWNSITYSPNQWSNHSIAGDNTNSVDDFSLSGYDVADFITSGNEEWKDFSQWNNLYDESKNDNNHDKFDQNACGEIKNSPKNSFVKISANHQNFHDENQLNTEQNHVICKDQNDEQFKMSSKPSSIDSTINSPVHSSQKDLTKNTNDTNHKNATINSLAQTQSVSFQKSKISPLKNNVKESPIKTLSTTSSTSSLKINCLNDATIDDHGIQGQKDSLIDSGYQKSPQSPLVENFTTDDSDSEMAKLDESKAMKSDGNINETCKKNSKSKFKFSETKIPKKKDTEKNCKNEENDSAVLKCPAEIDVIQLDIVENPELLVDQEPLPVEAENIFENPPRLEVVENGDLINNNRDGEGNNYEEQILAVEIAANIPNNDNVPEENLDLHNENHIILEENQENVLLIQQNPEVDDEQPNVSNCGPDEIQSFNDFDLESQPPSSLDVNLSNNDIQIHDDSLPHPIHIVNIGSSFGNQESDNVALAINENENGLNLLAEPFPDWLIRLLRGNVEASEDLDFMSQGDNLTVNPNDEDYDDSSSSQDSNDDNEPEDDDGMPDLIDIESDEGLVMDVNNLLPPSSSQETINDIDNEEIFFDTIDTHPVAEVPNLHASDPTQILNRIDNFSSSPTLELNTQTETTSR